MMHDNVRTKVLDAHCRFAKPVYEGSQRFSLLLANANQGDGGQVVRPACSKLGLELRHKCDEAINGVGWKFGEPAEGSSLQGCGKHSAHHCIVLCV